MNSNEMGADNRRLPAWKDGLLLFAERVSRQIYWSFPWLRHWRHEKGKNVSPSPQECRRADLLLYLKSIGVESGALVMAHTGIGGLSLLDERNQAHASPVGLAQALMEDLLKLVGQEGTLVMPTHAKYQTEELETGSSTPITYDPRRSPCGVGLVNELFWRRKGVKRSAFPFNMLAVHGPLSDELLRNNLNEGKPSPHGLDSGYYRICQQNGLVVSIGVPLRECITIAHVVEEIREDWPIKNFYSLRRYLVTQDGTTRDWSVRLRKDVFAKFCYCRQKMGRDLVADGVIHEGWVGTVRVDWARAGEVKDFFWQKTAKKPYPYYALWTIRKQL